MRPPSSTPADPATPATGAIAATPSLGARIAEFAAAVVRPRATDMAMGSEEHFPRWLLSAAAERGLAGLLIPVEHGGAGASHLDFACFIEAVARECASSAVILDVHESVASEPLVRFGSDEQRRRYLPRLASGEWLGAFALSEAASGSDAGSLQTRAARTAGGYRLDGSKLWITNAGAADLYIVMARTGEAGARGVSAFLVEAALAGVHPGRPMRKLGLRGSWTAELVLDGVEVPEDARLGAAGAGFSVAMAALDSGRIGISAQATGIAQGALDAAVAFVRARHPAPHVGDEDLLLQSDAAVRHASTGLLADMEAQVAGARQLTRHAARACDSGQPFTREAAVAKLVATDAAVAVAHTAVEVCAPDSAGEGHPAAIRMRDAKACTIYEGTNQVQRMVIARELLRGS